MRLLLAFILELLVFGGCGHTPAVTAEISAPRAVSLVDTTTSFVTWNAWVARIGRGLVIYVASDARDDDPYDPAPTALSVGAIDDGSEVQPIDGEAVSLRFRDAGSNVDCDKWSGTLTWERRAPLFRWRIDTICAGAHLLVIVDGHEN